MKFQLRTLVSWLAAGAVLSAASAQILTSSGLAFPISPNTLLATLPLIGFGIFFATLPIAQYRKSAEGQEIANRMRPPNPFFAFRALLLSRAIMITGALFLGWHAGLLIWLLSFGSSTSGTLTPTLLGTGGSAVMILGGYLGQQNCRTPKDKDGEVIS